jgi:hypothetical protein
MPGKVAIIESEAFSGCTSLTSATIPGSVYNIKRRAFYGCTQMSSLHLGENIEQIGEEAFAGCDNIYDIRIDSKKVREYNENIFSNDTYNNALLHVPAGRKAFYERITPWHRFIITDKE